MTDHNCKHCKRAMECIIGDFWVCKTCEPVSKPAPSVKPETRKRGTYPVVTAVDKKNGTITVDTEGPLRGTVTNCSCGRVLHPKPHSGEWYCRFCDLLGAQKPPASYDLTIDDIDLEWSDMEKITEEMFPIGPKDTDLDEIFLKSARASLRGYLWYEGNLEYGIDAAEDYLRRYHDDEEADLFLSLVKFYKRQKGIAL